MALRLRTAASRAYFRGVKTSPDLEAWAAYRETHGDRFYWNRKTLPGVAIFLTGCVGTYFYIRSEMIANDLSKTGRDTSMRYWGPGTWPNDPRPFPTDPVLRGQAMEIAEQIRQDRERERQQGQEEH